jgi:hypothetical protein
MSCACTYVKLMDDRSLLSVFSIWQFLKVKIMHFFSREMESLCNLWSFSFLLSDINDQLILTFDYRWVESRRDVCDASEASKTFVAHILSQLCNRVCVIEALNTNESRRDFYDLKTSLNFFLRRQTHKRARVREKKRNKKNNNLH